MAADPLPDLSRDFDWHRQLLRDFRDIVREEVKKALGTSVQQMGTTLRATEKLVSSVESLGRQVGNLSADVARLTGYITARGMRDEAIDARLERFFEVVTPPIPREPT